MRERKEAVWERRGEERGGEGIGVDATTARNAVDGREEERRQGGRRRAPQFASVQRALEDHQFRRRSHPPAEATLYDDEDDAPARSRTQDATGSTTTTTTMTTMCSRKPRRRSTPTPSVNCTTMTSQPASPCHGIDLFLRRCDLSRALSEHPIGPSSSFSMLAYL
jgi:hypothetical protein